MPSRVLLVEDNELNRRLFAHVFRLSEFEVELAADGAEALARAARRPPDLVTLDLELPEIPGLEVARRLRQDPRLGSVPILAVSAIVSAEAARAVEGLGRSEFLRKPVGPGALLAAAERALAGWPAPPAISREA